MPFEKGHKLAKGGKREGSGRPTDRFNQEKSKIGDPLAILRFYWDVANGAELEQVVTDAGVTIPTPASVKDRLKAGELYLDRVIGKVPQGMELTGADGDPFSGIPTPALAELIKALKGRTSQDGGGKS